MAYHRYTANKRIFEGTGAGDYDRMCVWAIEGVDANIGREWVRTQRTRKGMDVGMCERGRFNKFSLMQRKSSILSMDFLTVEYGMFQNHATAQERARAKRNII